ncbi:MAG: P-loop NTPase [Anaerolineales bacterium]|nr:P-loop NTPase [Anaerolineales bacterium]
MTVIGILSAKGGVGASLVATNLGCVLADFGQTLLLDLNPGSGADDLLLDLSPQRSWVDLLPVVKEISPKHLQLVIAQHPSGLNFMRTPEVWLNDIDWLAVVQLLGYLTGENEWLLLDMPTGMSAATQSVFSMMDIALIVTTADPPALRAAGRLIKSIPVDLRGQSGLVVNQITRRHPVSPAEIARSLEIPLLAALQPDPRAVGYQVSFGNPCVSDHRSSFGRGVVMLAAKVRKAIAGRKESGHAPSVKNASIDI